MSQHTQKLFPYELLQMYRSRAGLTQSQLAAGVGLSGKRMVQYWEAGTSLPKVDSLKKLIALFLKAGSFGTGKEKEEARQLWQAVKENYDARPNNLTPYPLFDEGWFEELLKTPRTPTPATPRVGLDLEKQITSASAAVGPKPLHNLPQPLTSLVGREPELAEICQLLKQQRLLTLTGTGGVGKTRLALAASHRLLSFYPAGVWWVELAVLTQEQEALLVQTVARQLGVREVAGRSVLEALLAHLKSRPLLLVLDNCEHLLEGCSRLVEEILRHCPQVVILVTSRERLSLSGEALLQVPSLSFPADEDLDNLGDKPETALLEFEAIALFVARARLVLPHFELSKHNARQIVEICQRLDGIPLALELAVARLELLSPEQIASRLSDRFRLLTGGSRTALPRQQTLRATIDWSYELLTEKEKLLFGRLAVFASSWSLVAAEQVCSGAGIEEWEVLERLGQLVNKSLVVVNRDEANGETRYGYLETIREYAQDKLNQSEQAPIFERKHCLYFCQYSAILHADEQNPKLLNHAELEHPNIRKALHWALKETTTARHPDVEAKLEEDSPAVLALKLTGNLGQFWQLRGYFSEGRSWLKEALLVAEQQPYLAQHPARSLALVKAGFLAMRQGELENAKLLLEESLKLTQLQGNRTLMAEVQHLLGNYFNQLGCKTGEGEYFIQARKFEEENLGWVRQQNLVEGLAMSLANLAQNALALGDYERAKTLAEESLATSRKISKDNKKALADSLFTMAGVANLKRDYSQAKIYLEQALLLYQEVGFKLLVGGSLSSLARLEYRLGAYEQALLKAQKGVNILEELGASQPLIFALETLAFVKTADLKSNPEKLVQLFGAVNGQLKKEGITLFSGAERLESKEILAALTIDLGESVFEQAWAEGQALSLAQTVELAHSF